MSVFGPGFGESIVFHLGGGNWAVVDSCLDPVSKQPAALGYLAQIGVDAAKSVQLVIATHWHDDHMQGISKIFQTAVHAVFACTSAVMDSAFKEVLAAWAGTRFLTGGSGVDELRAVMTELKNRTESSRFVAPKLAAVGKILWPIHAESNPLAMSITCLSPSDAAVLATISRLKGVAPRSSRIRRRLPNLHENDTSVVLSVEAAGHRVLLGGDLHVRADRSFGWLAIVDDYAGVDARHHAFKIPHHGSSTGDHDEIWNTLTAKEPCAVTTPFVAGGVRLPSIADCHRILARTQAAYLSAPPAPAKFRDSNRTVEKEVLGATHSVQFVPGKYGHVRLRKHVDALPAAAWRVELFGSAVSMVDYVQKAL